MKQQLTPSSEDFQFKLTQKAIPSLLYTPQYMDISASLQYTRSEISIVERLEEKEDVKPTHLGTQADTEGHDSKFKVASTKGTIHDPNKTTNRSINLRERAISCRKIKQGNSLYRKYSLHIINLPTKQKELPIQQVNDRSRAQSALPTSSSRKSISTRQKLKPLFKPERLENEPTKMTKHTQMRRRVHFADEDVVETAIQVKMIGLRPNQTKGKIYLKKIIQNRQNALHALQEFSGLPLLCESRKTSFEI